MPHEAPATPTEDYNIKGKVVRQKISLTNDFQQAGERYRSLGKVDQEHLVDNIVDSLGKAEKPIQQRMVASLKKADSELGKRVAKGLRLQ
jgi:catalase